jgi:hypothetical protein
MRLLEFDHDDPKLDRSDPRVYRYDGGLPDHDLALRSVQRRHSLCNKRHPPMIAKVPSRATALKIVASRRSARTITSPIPPYLRAGYA